MFLIKKKIRKKRWVIPWRLSKILSREELLWQCLGKNNKSHEKDKQIYKTLSYIDNFPKFIPPKPKVNFLLYHVHVRVLLLFIHFASEI